MDSFPDISVILPIELVNQFGPNWLGTATLKYSRADPYATHADLQIADSENVVWIFARDLLADGVTHPVGPGDVAVMPSDEDDHAILLSLLSPAGQALLKLPLGGTVEYLKHSFRIVPEGMESAFIDLDAELALLGFGPDSTL